MSETPRWRGIVSSGPRVSVVAEPEEGDVAEPLFGGEDDRALVHKIANATWDGLTEAQRTRRRLRASEEFP